MLTINFILVVTENNDWWWSLLQTFKQVDHFGLLLDIFNNLKHVQIGSTRTADVHHDWHCQRLLSEVLNFLRHRRGEEKRLPLVLSRFEPRVRFRDNG